ncbi:multiple sugar transport system substrate-binding protein [Kaistia soli DSM 19436]|uniref:Multiple sugar transport system substrate-binding protein n=1 Tax=Kaistia soli DSM 19436 TaxID=1122133 RepID=A0A1M4WVF0_9HYPH|nr:sugar ABC transporter substrate-binding protein [Kaistia soli]SHE85137.1 multiple sugar transport system substrate-binding protein [Kaistia soli DSM 19436]
MLKKLAKLALSAAIGLAAISAANAQSDEKATLKLMSFGGEAQTAAIKNAIARFNKSYPNVTVELTMDPISTGWGDYVTRVLSQFNARNAADVYGTAIETFRTFESKKLFIPLDDYIAKNPGYSDFAPSLFEQSSYQGKTYFIPIGWNNIMINYNRALFKEAGVDYPKPEWTWDQFRETAKKLTKRDTAGNATQFGYEVPNQFFFIQPWFFSNGTSILTKDWSGSNMLDPKVAESLQFLHDLIHVDKVSPIPGKDTMDNQFNAGQVAMISRGHWIVENAKRAKLDMDVTFPPQKETGITVIGFGGYAVSRTSKNPELAKALVTELTSFETQKEEGEGGGGVPGRKSAADTEAFLAFPPSAALYYQSLPNTLPVPSPANFQEVEKIFIRNYQAMMADEISIAEGVKKTNEELEASFKRLAAKGG